MRRNFSCATLRRTLNELQRAHRAERQWMPHSWSRKALHFMYCTSSDSSFLHMRVYLRECFGWDVYSRFGYFEQFFPVWNVGRTPADALFTNITFFPEKKNTGGYVPRRYGDTLFFSDAKSFVATNCCSTCPVVLFQWFLTSSPGTPSKKSGVPRRNVEVFSFNFQMHQQQRPSLWIMP